MILRFVRRASTKISPKTITDDYTYCINNVRKVDYENFICTALLRPAILSRPAMAIRAFNVELAQIRDQVSNVQIGRMRLEFWRETIEMIYSSLSTKSILTINNPMARELDRAIKQFSLTKLWFQRLISSRETTLNDMPFATIDQLEAYVEQSITPTFYLLLELAQQRSLNADHIASHLGRAQGIVNIVRGIPHHAHKRRCLIPLSYLVEQNLSQQDIFDGKFSSEQFRHILYQLCTRAYFHLQKTVQLFEQDRNLTRRHSFFSLKTNEIRTIFLPIIVVNDYLKRIKEIDFDLTKREIHQRNPWLVWNLWRHQFPHSKDLL